MRPLRTSLIWGSFCSAGSVDFLCVSGSGPAGLASHRRGGLAAGDHDGGRRGSPLGPGLVRGLVLVHRHARAGVGVGLRGPARARDRYTYLVIGLDVARAGRRAARGCPPRLGQDLVAGSRWRCHAAAWTWHQTGYWQTEAALWRHALDVDPENRTAHYELGTVLYPTDPVAAAAQFEAATGIAPSSGTSTATFPRRPTVPSVPLRSNAKTTSARWSITATRSMPIPTPRPST